MGYLPQSLELDMPGGFGRVADKTGGLRAQDCAETDVYCLTVFEIPGRVLPHGEAAVAA